MNGVVIVVVFPVKKEKVHRQSSGIKHRIAAGWKEVPVGKEAKELGAGGKEPEGSVQKGQLTERQLKENKV